MAQRFNRLCDPDADLPVQGFRSRSSSKLARAIGVSPRYLLQIGARLREAGFVHVGHGSAGGYQLSRPPAKISLMDVIMAMNRKGNVAVLPDKRLPKEDFHTLECTYRQLEKGIQRQLESITISELSQTEREELNRQTAKTNT